MNTADPIRDVSDISALKHYYHYERPNLRNYLLLVVGLNTALRISDILLLTWDSVYDFYCQEYRRHIYLEEQKTGKKSLIFINSNLKEALEEYRLALQANGQILYPDRYIISHSNKNTPLSRVQAYRIIKEATDACHLSDIISCHSLRKTFGYHAWKKGAPPALLMEVYNHSSFEITKRYLGIGQDDKDKLFEELLL